MLKKTSIGLKKIVVSAVIAVTALMAVYLWRDLHLSDNEIVPVPDIVVENIEVNREIDGKKWKLKAPRVEHKDGIIYGYSLDVEMNDKAGKQALLKSKTGTFTRESEDITLNDSHGTFAEKEHLYNLRTGTAHYDSASKTWHFLNSVLISDDKSELTAAKGTLDTKSGIISLTGDSIIKWGK